MSSTATISQCGHFRYTLTREWGDIDDFMFRRVCWIMLNPSTADAEQDDPTIRRCAAFSKAWKYHGLIVVNCYALRATDPGTIRQWWKSGRDPVGGENDHHIATAAETSSLVVCAWGSKCSPTRAGQVRNILAARNIIPHHLGLTRDGSPKHPLYLLGELTPKRWEPTP